MNNPRTSFITDAHGHRTHAIVPIEEWQLLTIQPVKPDKWDLEAIARIKRLTPEDLEPVPITNPIKSARYEAEVTQVELARRMGITAGMLSRMEREGRRLRQTTIDKALAALKPERKRSSKR